MTAATRRLAQVAEQLGQSLHPEKGREKRWCRTSSSSSTSSNTSSSKSSSKNSSSAAGPELPQAETWASRDRELFAHLPDNGQSAIASLGGLPSPFDEAPPPVPLTDEQLYNWCSTGAHVINPTELRLPQALHQLLYAKLKFALHEEYQPGEIQMCLSLSGGIDEPF